MPSVPGTGLPYPNQPPSNIPDLPPSVVYPPTGATGNTIPTTQYPPQPQSYPPQPQSYPPQPQSYPPQPQSYPATNTQPAAVSCE